MLQQQLIQRNLPEGKKERLFRLFHTLLHHHNIHINVFMVLLVIQILQMVYYGCHSSFQKIWPNKTTEIVQIVLSFTDLSGLWQRAGGPAVLVFASLSMIVNVLATALILYEVNKNPDKLAQTNLFSVKFLTYYFIFIRTILVLPMVLAFGAFASPSLYNLSSLVRILLGIVSGLGFVFLIVNSIIGVYFYRDNSPFSELEFSSSVNFLDEFRLGIKVVLGLYGSMAQKGTTVPLIFGIVYLIALLISIYFINSRYSLINYPFNRIYELGIVLPLWTILATLAQVIASPTQSVGLILWGVGLVIIPFAWSHLQSKNQIELLTTHYKSLMTSNQYLAYNYGCIRLANNREDPSNLTLLEGILSLHIQDCKKPAELCVCGRVRAELIGKSLEQSKEQTQEETELWFQFIKNNLLEVSDKFQTSPQIWFLLSYIENDVLNNKFRSLHSLEQALYLPCNLKFQVLAYHHLRRVETKMQTEDKLKNQKKAVDINRYFKFEIDFCKLQQKIEESTYMHCAFWQFLVSEKANRKKMYAEGVKIIKHLDDIKRRYGQLMHINSYNIHCMVLYANFMKVIINDNEVYDRSQEAIEAAKRTFSQSFKIQSDVEKQKYGDNSVSATVIISGQRKNIGVIKHSTSKVSDIIGYTPYQLLGQNINILMPKFIGNMHDDVLRNYLELSRSEFDYVERLVPMIDINNYMVLARMLTKPFPNLLNGLELIGIFNSVMESSLNHPGEKPKYVLYRSDTGQVQALSESCNLEYSYKINKIDENHETSSQLTFSTLFTGIKEADITDGQRVKCYANKKRDSNSQMQEVAIQLYQKLLIYYYSVNLRLLCFYSLKNYKDIESVRQFLPDHLESSLIKDGEMNNRQSRLKDPNDKTTKEKFLHEISKKSNLVVTEPQPLKVLRYWGIGYLILLLAMAIFYLVFHLQKDTFQDFIAITRYNGQVVGDICETAINSRMEQLSYFYPADVPSFAELNSNLSLAVNSVQNGQIQVNTRYLKYNNDFNNFPTKQYTYSTTSALTFSTINLNNHIFDFVSSSASMKSLTQSVLNFPFQLMQIQNVTAAATMLFKVRYNSLFQILPTEKNFIASFTSFFDELINSESKRALVFLLVALFLIIIIFVVAILLAISVVNKTDKTMLLFGYLTRHEIEKEMDNCNSFLDLFYQDSYMIKLKQRQKSGDCNTSFQFAISEPSSGRKSSLPLLSPSDRKIPSALDIPGGPSSARVSVHKIQYLEKQLHLRTEGELLISQGAEQDNQNQFLRGPGSSSDQQSIHDKLSAENDGCRSTIALLYIILMLLFGGYFIEEYVVYTGYNGHIKQEISLLQLTYSNLNSLKLMRLYSLETYIDNSQFENETLLNTTLKSVYDDLYANQRNIDDVIFKSHKDHFPFNYHNICTSAIIGRLSSISTLKYYSSTSFSVAECSSFLNNALGEGIRLGIVGYTESLLNISRLNIQTHNFSLTGYSALVKMEKYLEAPYRELITFNLEDLSVLIDEKKNLLIVEMVLFCIILVLIFVVVWARSINKLMERLTTTRTILGFIPVRVFVHNSKLTREYEEYIGELMA